VPEDSTRRLSPGLPLTFPTTIMLLRLLALLLGVVFCGSAAGQVVINEFVAENRASATDEDGSNPDWI